MGSVEPAMARCSDSECGFSVGRTVLGQDAVIDSVAPATQARCSDSGWWLQCWSDRPWSGCRDGLRSTGHVLGFWLVASALP